MKTKSANKLAHIKLLELNKQHEHLTKLYQELSAELKNKDSLKEKFRLLQSGLSSMQFAQNRLHPDIENLHILQIEEEIDSISEELLGNWVEYLERQIEHGKKRLEAGLLFGLLLEDSTRQTDKKKSLTGQEDFETSFIHHIQQPNTTDVEIFRQWLRHCISDIDKMQNKIKYFVEKEICKPVIPQEVQYVLHSMHARTYHHTWLKSEISNILGNAMLLDELAGAITILLNNFQEWDWNEEGVWLRSIWVKNKWRAFNGGDLIQTLFLETIAMRWGIIFKQLFTSSSFQERVDNKSRLTSARKSIKEDLFLKNFINHFEYNYLRFEDTYQGTGGDSTIINKNDIFFNLFQNLNAEIKAAQIHQIYDSSINYYVLYCDFKNFFLTFPHKTLVVFLQEMGLSEDWLAFFERYIQTPYRYNGQVFKAAQGLSLSHLFSQLFADLILRLLDKSLNIEGVVFYRYMDDIYIIAQSSNQAKQAWQKIQEFCHTTGLNINHHKTGLVCLGKPDETGINFLQEFEDRLPLWQYLSLGSDGLWRINQDKLKIFAQNLTQQLKDQESVFGFVNTYNRHIRFLLQGFAIGYPISRDFLHTIAQTIVQFNKQLFGDNQDIIGLLRQKIKDKFPHIDSILQQMPDAWYYLPVMAGGVALINPMCEIASLREAYQRFEHYESDALSSTSSLEDTMAVVVDQILNATPLSPQKPSSIPLVEGLLYDFVGGDTRASGGQQLEINVYWRWLFYTYRHQLLNTFGSFRFLLPQLVPIQATFNQSQANEHLIAVVDIDSGEDLPF